VLTNLRRVLREHSDEKGFPFEALNDELNRMNIPLYLDENAYKRFLSVSYPDCIFQLALLYDDFPVNSVKQQLDHIFPKGMFLPVKMTNAGIPLDKQQRFTALQNRLGNLELLLDRENNEKRDTSFDQWLPTRDKEFYARHLIPADPNLWKFENFEEFFIARESLIVDRLKKIMLTAKHNENIYA
jgi:hypothetical protein